MGARKDRERAARRTLEKAEDRRAFAARAMRQAADPSPVAPYSVREEIALAVRTLDALGQQRKAVLKDQGFADRMAVAFQEPSVRQFITWTPEQRRSAIQMADAGTMIRAADLCDSMLGDDRVLSVYKTYANALVGCDLDFEDTEPFRGRSTTPSPLAKDLDDDWWTMFPEEELKKLLIWGDLLGLGIGQLVWPEGGKGRRVPRFTCWNPRFTRWSNADQQWFIRVGEFQQEIPFTPGDGKWVMYTPAGKSRPWALGAWRGMSLMWLLKTFALVDWAKHSEIHGSPIRVGQIDAKVAGIDTTRGTDAVRKELQSDIASIGSDTAIVFPPGFSLQLVEAKARTWEMFQAQSSMADTSISIQVIGSNLPTEVGKGVSTGATAATLVRNDYTASAAQSLSTCTHQQGLVWWAAVNYPSAQRAPWALWRVEPPIDTAALATTWQAVGQACTYFQQAGLSIDPKQLAEKFDIELAQAAAPAPAPGTPLVPPKAPGAPPPPSPGQAPAKGPPGPFAALSLAGRYEDFGGLKVGVESEAGSSRHWTAMDGSSGSTRMLYDYGFICGLLGADGEELDCYLGPDRSAEWAYVVHQMAPPDYRTYDEDKVMLGWPSTDAALTAYELHRSDGRQPIGGVTKVRVADLLAMAQKRPKRVADFGRGDPELSTARLSAATRVAAKGKQAAEAAHAAGDRVASRNGEQVAKALAPLVREVARVAEEARKAEDPRAYMRRGLRALAAMEPSKDLVSALKGTIADGYQVGHEHVLKQTR